MKNKFSTKWKSSKQPRKQRKFRANAPLHIKKKFVRVNLSKPLREKQGKRNAQVKKGDIVKIMKGTHKKKTGKVLEVSLKNSKIVVEGIQVKKQDGSKVNIKLQPSNLQIIELSEKIPETKKQEKMGTEKKQKSEDKKTQKEKSVEAEKAKSKIKVSSNEETNSKVKVSSNEETKEDKK